MKRRQQFLSISLLTVFLLLIIMFSSSADAVPYENDEGALTMVTLNIGKADAIILSIGELHFMVDTGYQYTVPRLLTALEQMQITSLDGVFITHNDKDHVGGLAGLLASDIAVKAVYAPNFSVDSKDEDHPVIKAAAAHGLEVQFLNANDTLTFGETSFLVHGPLSYNQDNDNNNSLVMTMITPHGKILLTGDMKLQEEFEILRAGTLMKCEILKVPFHGDNSATSPSLLSVVKPRMAVIPTSSEQEPDTPSKELLRSLASMGCETFVTENLEDALLILMKDGKPEGKNIAWALPDPVSGLTMSIKLSSDTLTLYNTTAQEISLVGASVFSTRGEDYFLLPGELTLPAGGTFTIASSGSGTDADLIIPSSKRIWHKSKYDRAELYDRYGRLIVCTDNGQPE